MEDKCTKFNFAFGLPVRANIRSGRAAVRRLPGIGEDAERAERNFRYGGPASGLSENDGLQDAARAGSTDRRSERMQKARRGFRRATEEKC